MPLAAHRRRSLGYEDPAASFHTPHARRPRLDLRVLDLTVYFFRLYKYFHEKARRR